MLEAYSNNISVPSESSIPLNNISLQIGKTVTPSGASSVMLNCPGVYGISMDAFAEPSAVGDITIQLAKDGVNLPQAISTVTGATGDTETLHFETRVRIPCQCSAPSEIQFMNNGVAVTGLHININVAKMK